MTFDLNHLQKRRKVRKRRTLTSEVQSGYKMLVAVVVTLNLVLGTSYFMINSQKTVLGYKLKQLQVTNEHLKDDAKKIDSSIVSATAVKNIEEQALLRRMVDIQSIFYTVGSTRRAQR